MIWLLVLFLRDPVQSMNVRAYTSEIACQEAGKEMIRQTYNRMITFECERVPIVDR